ncbi:hypothetical protein CGJ15_25755, partial [Vibrio parahaemolyticus]
GVTAAYIKGSMLEVKMMIVRTSLLLVAVLVLQAEARSPPAQRPGRLCGRYCGSTLSPVCGSDGRTYHNQCAFENAKCANPGLTVVNEGPCGNKLCGRNCGKILRPVCATNGKTYNNLCLLEVAQCKNPSISLAYNGPCNIGFKQ